MKICPFCKCILPVLGWKSCNKCTSKLRQENAKKWRIKNPEKMRFINKQKNYKRKKAIGSHSLKEWEEIKKSHRFCCVNCGRQEPFNDLWITMLTEDHIIPISRGGSNYIQNIQPLCILCNIKKSNY